MAFKVDFSKFKKVSSDKNHTVMEHDDGHQIKIAHGALSHGMRKELSKLPAVKMADGGEVDKRQQALASMRDAFATKEAPAPSPSPSETAVAKPTPKEDPGSTSNLNLPRQKEIAGSLAKAFSYAKGGTISSDDQIIAHKKEIDDYNNLHEDAPHAYSKDIEDKMSQTGVTKYAEGSTDIQAPTPTPSLSSLSGQMTDMGAPAANPQVFAPQSPSGDQVQAQSPAPSPTPNQSASQPSMIPNPAQGLPTDVNMGEARDKQIAGITGMSSAEAKGAQATAQATLGAAKALDELSTKYSDALKPIQDHISAMREDIASGHVDPNRYYNSMDTGQKMLTGVALALGGLGGALAGGGNQAADYLNKQIDRDIEAQKSDLGRKQGLLSSVMQDVPNLRDATDMTKILMLDHTKMLVENAQAKAAAPEAKARAQQLLGQLDATMAPMVQQQALRSVLMGNNGSLKDQDPASFIPMLIKDPSTQKAVASEIERAQNTKRMSGHIMDQFDGVVKDFQAGAGLGRIPNMIRDNRGLQGLKALVNTTVTDLTGTARQAEFDSVAHNMLPAPGDTDSELAHKRDIFAQYMQAKASAPLAKANGIDLDKFKSTNMKDVGAQSQQPQYKIVGGVKYMRGPNGEAIKVD